MEMDEIKKGIESLADSDKPKLLSAFRDEDIRRAAEKISEERKNPIALYIRQSDLSFFKWSAGMATLVVALLGFFTGFEYIKIRDKQIDLGKKTEELKKDQEKISGEIEKAESWVGEYSDKATKLDQGFSLMNYFAERVASLERSISLKESSTPKMDSERVVEERVKDMIKTGLKVSHENKNCTLTFDLKENHKIRTDRKEEVNFFLDGFPVENVSLRLEKLPYSVGVIRPFVYEMALFFSEEGKIYIQTDWLNRKELNGCLGKLKSM